MKILMKKLLAVSALCGLAHTAGAVPTTWVDSIDFNPDVKVTTWTSYSYTHDITDNGFNTGVDDVSSYLLSVNLYDNRDPFYLPLEVALIDLPGFGGDSLYIDLSGVEYGGWSIKGNAQLEETGKLSINIASILGDFFIGDSKLIVHGNSAAVPEPTTLALFGMGLLGLGAMTYRKKARN